ncbi:DUF2905 domain-containing protein [Salipaludibacillus daqingensis]|uniref:DUF2905 domain-containing protein n=1 Tax=Salipaludibacillus daqingensis TaxID=3041001 RepID=UPI00247387D2|nr:DUF2905 domain-containing protein [Salipaludibacillus daqingensis]
MNHIPKLLISLGVILIVAGVLWQIGGRFISLGRLPGDILIQRGNSTFYFPIMTSIIVSIVLSLIFYLFGRLR